MNAQNQTMPLLPPAPSDVRKTKVVQTLLAKATPDDGLAEKAHQLFTTATPLLDLVIAGPFKEFTLHNRDHPKKLLHILEFLLPQSTFEELSALECFVIICAAFTHDLGMVLTSTERERFVSSEDFQDSIREWPEVTDALDRARRNLSAASDREKFTYEAEVFQLQEAGLCKFLRPLHATKKRYEELLSLLKRNSGRSDLFSLRDVSFERVLIDICESHNLDVGVLAEVSGPYDERFPRDLPIGGMRLNAQFCAAMLRVCDVLDFDRERTPLILFESLGISTRTLPGSEITLREWQKHMAIHAIDIEAEEVVISGDCQHPVIERAIRDFCSIIERELRETNAVIQRNTADICSRYTARLPITVRTKIRSVGYVFKDMALRLNESAIMSLLMGERLYSHPGAAAREMVQNAVDACQVRQMFEPDAHYHPSIELSCSNDEQGRRWLHIQDNGIGMDEYVLNEFFLRVGTSYYNSPEFNRLKVNLGSKGFTPISRFGIGVLAVFMIGDVLEVETQNIYSRRGDKTRRFLRIERLGGLAFVREVAGDRVGTLIRVRLKTQNAANFDDLLADIAAYLREVVVRPKFPIRVTFPGDAFTIGGEYRFFQLNHAAEQILAERNLEIIILDISRWSNQLWGSVAILFARDSEGRLSHSQGGSFVKFGSDCLRPDLVLDNYYGNVVTVNGFRMNLRKAAKILGFGRDSVSIAFDIDVVGVSEVVYHISRDKIIGDGANFFKNAFREAILKGLSELGVLERLAAETRVAIASTGGNGRSFLRGFGGRALSSRLLTPATMDAVQSRLPEDHWPSGIHKSIAAELRISNRLVTDAITSLIESGRVVNPNATHP